MSDSFLIRSGQLTLSELAQDYYHPKLLTYDPKHKTKVKAATQIVNDYVNHNKPAYGINTGFGKLAHKSISIEKLKILQKNLVHSHATGVGSLLSLQTVRLIIILKINALLQGYSGVRWDVIESLFGIANAGIMPCIPAKGSVGASGDLAPLAHLAYGLIGEGTVFYQGERICAKKALSHAGLSALILEPKEGLALLNGTQVSTALLVEALIKAQRLFDAEIIAGALSLFATKAHLTPFDLRIHALRKMKAQSDVAATILELFDHSPIEARQIQDPYSLRCQPQVMGACLGQIRYIAEYLENEINAVTDNPLIFVKDKEILSGGNFHAQWVAFGADAMATALCTMANISERRIALLMDPNLSGLPAFLIQDSGENSGFMMAQVTAAALASENKVLAHPASVDTIPTSMNQEDHVSMATFAARRLNDLLDNTSSIIAIELLCACQGIDLLGSTNLPPALKCTYDSIRQKVPFYSADHYLASDIAYLKERVEQGQFMLKGDRCHFFRKVFKP